MSRLFDEQFLRRLEHLHLVSRRVHAGQQRADRRSKKLGSGLEFADHRDYAPGDDFRHLDWKVYARMERMLVRLHEEEEDLLVYLLLDCSRSMAIGHGQATKFRYAAQLTAALAYIGLANLDRVCLVPFASQLHQPTAQLRGKKQIFQVFRTLEAITPDGKTALTDCVRRFTHRHKRRGMTVLLSDFYDPEGYEDAAMQLRYAGFEPILIQLIDEQELESAQSGELAMVDCETGAIRNVTMTPRLRRRYREVHQSFCDGLERFCRSNAISYISRIVY